MPKAIAIPYPEQNPFKAALHSAENFSKLAADFMYGSPKRIQYTMTFAIVLFSLSFALSTLSKTLLQTCPV